MTVPGPGASPLAAPAPRPQNPTPHGPAESPWPPHPAGQLCSSSPDLAWLSRPLRRQTESARHLEQMASLLKITPHHAPRRSQPGDRSGCGWALLAVLTSHLHRDRCERSLPGAVGPGDPSLTEAVQSRGPYLP